MGAALLLLFPLILLLVLVAVGDCCIGEGRLPNLGTDGDGDVLVDVRLDGHVGSHLLHLRVVHHGYRTAQVLSAAVLPQTLFLSENLDVFIHHDR